MELSRDKVFFIKKVFSKMRYDKMSNKYQIPVEVYLPLKLTDKQFNLLEQMCIDNDIELVRMPKRLSKEETIELFKRYKELKEKYEKEPIIEIEKEMYRVRNIIAEGHMEIVLKVLLRYFPDISSREDREDIYQTGYEVLLLFVDQFDLEKSDHFARFIYKYLIPYLYRRTSMLSNNLTIEDNNRLVNYIKKREEFFYKYNREPSIEEIGKILHLDKEEIEELKILEKRLDTVSYEEEGELSLEDDTLLIDDTFEEEMFKSLSYDGIRKMIDTLPKTQRECLVLYFGFEDGICYTFDEIALKLKMSHEGARKAVYGALYNIENSVRKQVLNSLYLDDNCRIETNPGVNDLVYLTHYLIKSLPKETLLELLSWLNDKSEETLKLYFGLEDGKEYSRQEISRKLGITVNTVNERIKNGINILIKIIKDIYKNKYVGTDREEYDFLSNMLLDYINNSRLTRVKRSN